MPILGIIASGISGHLTPTSLTVDYLVVAGGGPGGEGYSTRTGGGGAGGVRSTVTSTGGGGSLESAVTCNANKVYTIVIGAGGNGSLTNVNGNNSYFAGADITTIQSRGGGMGTQSQANATAGGSGGGAGYKIGRAHV